MMADDTGAGRTDGQNGGKGAADAMRDTAGRAREAFSDHVIDPARRAGEALRASGQKVADGSATIGLKIIEQAEQNSHQAFEAMREAAKAKDLGDVMRIQGDYLRDQGQRAMNQAREIGELIMQFGRDAVTPLRPGGDSKPD
ncbi:phasin family protein [Sphingomonas sp. RP10(2022)]|uniref:Phasin family protein n=1 Tax=Sphingomonas liriopis TaxID=2949094 RepID=A0A9X2HXH0_9SPHN|nr:phasin family protein [Sphingomonas liriopis]MCP3735229.1 phasin family protein [Sphingomonas liriopis]